MARTTLTRRTGRSIPTARSSRRATRTNRRHRPAVSSRSRLRQATTTRTRIDPQLQKFFDGFCVDLTAGDGQAVAACFELPSVMVMSDPKYGANQVLQDEDTVADFFDNAPAMYRERGIAQTVADLQDAQWLTPELVLVRARFPYLDDDGNDMGDAEESLYVVRRQGRSFAIAAALTLGTDSDRAAQVPTPRAR